MRNKWVYPPQQITLLLKMASQANSQNVNFFSLIFSNHFKSLLFFYKELISLLIYNTLGFYKIIAIY